MQKIFSVREFKAIPVLRLSRFQRLILKLIRVKPQQQYVYSMKLVLSSLPGVSNVWANDIIAVRDMRFAVIKEVSGLVTVTSLEATERELTPGWFHDQQVAVISRCYNESITA